MKAKSWWRSKFAAAANAQHRFPLLTFRSTTIEAMFEHEHRHRIAHVHVCSCIWYRDMTDVMEFFLASALRSHPHTLALFNKPLKRQTLTSTWHAMSKTKLTGVTVHWVLCLLSTSTRVRYLISQALLIRTASASCLCPRRQTIMGYLVDRPCHSVCMLTTHKTPANRPKLLS